jgi:D-alanyl-lipoteichoic acid acyltransferase DltB (MBOAT superfamily)
MGWEKPERKFLNFLLYIFFYPKFLSGPIERSNHFLPQLRVAGSFDAVTVSEGLRIALIGFFKKVVIANQLGTLVNEAYSGMETFSGLNLWIIVLIQPLYLYFDFSGYTDIAIGIAKTYGINLLPNFNRPFLSENMTTFWKRFHISLSLWFNDYIFRQLSFKYRKWGKYASVFAVFITFTLFGIWHGAGWSFMVLGFLQAVAINYEFFTKRQRIKIGSMIPSFWRVLFSRLFTYFFYGVSLIFFFARDLDAAFLFISGMVSFIPGPSVVTIPHLTSFALSVAILFLIFDYLKEDYDEISNRITNFFNNSKIIRILFYYVMVMLIITFMGSELTFIYQVF